MNCKHGLQEGTCAWCNNTGFETKPSTRTICVDPIIEEYNNKRKYFTKDKSDWTKDEIEIVHDTFKEYLGRKEFKRKVYETSIVLERSRGAVSWMVKHLFSKQGKELHRGKEVLSFRQEKGIVCL